MKLKILTAVANIAIFTAFGASAAPSIVTQTSPTINVTPTGTTFTFNTFNATLGTLNAVSLILESSTLQGSFSLNRTSGAGTSATITNIAAVIGISGAEGSGFGNATYISPSLTYNRTPSGNLIINNANTNRFVTIDGTTQSIIASPTTATFADDFSLSYYSGDGISTFDYSLSVFNQFSNAPGFTAQYSSNINNMLSPTSVTLQYSYTPGIAPIPEPGQVAASLLLLSGVGAYVFIKRRKKSAPAAA